MDNAKMICPYCNSYFTPEMEVEYYNISRGCTTCGWGKKDKITVTVECDNCKKVVYKKETVKED